MSSTITNQRDFLPYMDNIPSKVNHNSRMHISVRSPADFHVHLRQGSISKLVTTHVRKGGFDLAYVMVSITGILFKKNGYKS